MKKLILAAVIPFALLAGCASIMPGGSEPAMMKEGMLVNAKGITLYSFDRDVRGNGKSNCNGDCAVKWPPHMASASAQPHGDYTVVVRNDGSRQWAYKGWPLYTWPEDQDPGDKYGDNYNKVWHVVQ